MRLIIDYDPDVISASDVLRRVATVVAGGRLSEAGGVKHFCWFNVFGDGVTVATRRKKRNQTSDSFIVEKKP